MFAHKIVDFTGPDDLQWVETEEPAADGGVLIDVAAAGVSFADLLQTQGRLPDESASSVYARHGRRWSSPRRFARHRAGCGPACGGAGRVRLLAGGRVHPGGKGAAVAGRHELPGRRGRSPELPDGAVRAGPAGAGATRGYGACAWCGGRRRDRRDPAWAGPWAAHSRGRQPGGQEGFRRAVRGAPRRPERRLARRGARPDRGTGDRHRHQPGSAGTG